MKTYIGKSDPTLKAANPFRLPSHPIMEKALEQAAVAVHKEAKERPFTTTPLPSRRYTCIHCGGKYRRGNKPEQRLMDPVCPGCSKHSRKHLAKPIKHAQTNQ